MFTSQSFRSYSIRRQLLAYLFLAIIIFLVGFSGSILWLTQQGASTLIISNAKETNHVLAEQARLALLTESAENAESALQQVMAFPDVVGAGLVTASGSMLGWQGDEVGREYFSQLDWSVIDTEERVFESSEYWHIASQVLLSNDSEESEFELFELNEEKLGYALVTFSKQSLSNINLNLFTTISIACLLVLIGLPLVVTLVTRKLLLPFQKLSYVMQHNHRTGEHQRIEVQGSEEAQLIGQSFNTMMETLDYQDEKLRNHRDKLEAEVNIRTKELVVARDAALISNRHKSEFLANVTHELRSPIQSILGYVELVREDAENEGLLDILSDLDKVTRNADRLYALINSLLDLSKIEAGRMEVNWQKVELQGLLDELEDVTAPLAPQHNNSLSITNQCALEQVTIDQEKTLQILINLVSNACKFTQNGKVDVRVYQQQNKLLFEVKDTGIGIPEHKKEAIFYKFQQVDGSDARKFGGTGLGLAISKQFCELMEGEMLLTSEEGLGSCFTLVLRVK